MTAPRDMARVRHGVRRRRGKLCVTTSATSPLRLDTTWCGAWTTSTSLFHLGMVTCNHAVIPPFRAAREEVISLGLGKLIHTADLQRKVGSRNARLARFGAGWVSLHARGIAVDLNVDDNALVTTPVLDPELVSIMAKRCFTWPGLFLRPDDAHIERVGTRA